MVLLLVAAAKTTAVAQPTTGTIVGRILDAQGRAVPGATVSAVSPATGLARTVVTDVEGTYRLRALPAGRYHMRAVVTGFATVDRSGVQVSVGQAATVDLLLKVATVSEAVVVTGETSPIDATASSVGGVIESRLIEVLPLNGRQFANLAAIIPGVGLGFHSDATKSTQFSPQINGGNGRNVNYQVDGGDNNDDTVGGLLQLFPLEAIQEFRVITARSRAEDGRSQGGVMNIVTRSGTNDVRGGWFTMVRDDRMNAITTTERNNSAARQDYRRYQYGGSLGGPITRDRIHSFGAFERTQQDTFQVVSTLGLFPELDGTFGTPYRETLAHLKVTANLAGAQYLAVRYGRNQNSQPFGASPTRPVNGWSRSTNAFNSFNVNHNAVIGSGLLNEFVFQYSDFTNDISANSTEPYQQFPNGVAVGQSPNTPQSSEQRKWQFRNDVSWHVTGRGGVGHDMKAGVNVIHEPRLFGTLNSGRGVLQHTHLDNSVNGPLSVVTLTDGEAAVNIPLKQYAFYVQDDWRVTRRLTVNLGLRYDLVDGFQFDQSKNPNFVILQNAGRAGLLSGIKGLENFGKTPKNDTNNWQPRFGFAYDVDGGGTRVLRGGWGLYTELAFINSNVQFAASDATGLGFGAVLSVDNQSGIRNPDGTFYRVGQPVSNIASQNQANPALRPLFGQFTDPRLQMPYTRQASLGWSQALSTHTVISADLVAVDGRDLNTRPRINTIGAGGARRLAFLRLSPNAIGTRPAISAGRSEYRAAIVGVKRRMAHGLDASATYTLASARGTAGTAVDELNANSLQDPVLLYDDPRVMGPTSRTDARHSGAIAAVWQWRGFLVAPFFIFKSPLPVSITEGLDTNRNGERNDLPARAYKFAGLGRPPEDIGPCDTWNCGRGAWRTQLNLRVARAFSVTAAGRSARVEATAEVFNLLNASNPSGFVAARLLGTGAANPTFMQPTSFSGDFQQPEQRVGQIGFRISF